MQLTRRHSTRDFLVTTFFGPALFSLLFVPAIILWAQGEIPVSADESLSLLGVGVILLLFLAFIIIAIHKYRSPWYVQIGCIGDDCTLTARNPKDTIVFKKAAIISAKVQARHSPKGGGAVGAIIIYTQNDKPKNLCIRGDGSWRDESGVVLRQKKFCEALVSMLTS